MKKKLTELILCAAVLGGIMAAVGWFTQGVLRIILLAVLYFTEAEVLVSIVRLVLKEPETPKKPREEAIRFENEWFAKRQDPALVARLRPVGYILWGFSFLLIICSIINVGPYWLHGLACLGCFAACVILCALWPACFSIVYIEGEKNGGYTFPIVNLLVPLFISLGAGTIRALMAFCFTDWMAVLNGILMTAASVGLILRLAVPELRRCTGNWAGVMFFVVFFGLGITMPLNHFLAPQPPQTVTAMVTAYNPGGHRNPADYTLLLPDGQEINMIANDGFSERKHIYGDRIELEYHQGGLGIDYYSYAD